jgi:phage shock protein C
MKTYSKRLYKSTDNKVIAGVMGGFGEYFDIDPVVLRVMYIGLSAFTALAPGILAYILMAIIMPRKPMIVVEKSQETKEPEKEKKK